MSTTLLLTILFTTATYDFKLPEGVLSALCYVESTHDTQAVHKDDGKGHSLGVCQIKHPTAKLMGFKGTSQELMIPYNNVYYAGKYLQHQLNRYNGDMNKALAAYNAGTYFEGQDGKAVNKKYVSKVRKAWGK